MRQKLLSEGAKELSYEIRGIVKLLCARWPGRNAGRRDGKRGEAYFFLDFFGSFLHQGKKNKSILILK
jgi:hypothetical protein